MDEPSKNNEVAVAIIEQIDPTDRPTVLMWAQEMERLRESDLAYISKARKALSITSEMGVMTPLAKALASGIKHYGWDERSFPMKAGISLAAFSMLFTGGSGIALFGTAFALPLWVVFGAGGTFIATLIGEFQRTEVKDIPPKSEEPPKIKDLN